MSKKPSPSIVPSSSASVSKEGNAALISLLARASCDELTAPAPQGAQLARILSAGLRAPDHGKIRPWRYVVITGEARPDFAQKVMEAVARQEPDLPQKKLEKRRNRFTTTPAIIALGMALESDHKIPLWEQRMAVGAGAMNVLNALFLEGFGGVWISGPFCRDPFLAESLGLKKPDKKDSDKKSLGAKSSGKKKSGKKMFDPEPDFLAGFLLIGTPKSGQKPPRRPDIADYMHLWQPEPLSLDTDLSDKDSSDRGLSSGKGKKKK